MDLFHLGVRQFEVEQRDVLLKPLQPKALIERTQAILTRREKERRKREIQAQIDALQIELKNMEGETAAAPETAARPAEVSDRYLSRGRLTLDLHARRLTVDQRTVDLPPTAFDYLLVLVRHAPNVVDYQTLVAEAQGFQAGAREAQEIVKWHVHHIRQAIEGTAMPFGRYHEVPSVVGIAVHRDIVIFGVVQDEFFLVVFTRLVVAQDAAFFFKPSGQLDVLHAPGRP